MLLHGWMATAALNWYSSLAYLGQRFRVVAPNLRGHGREGRLAPPFSLDACSDDLAALILALDLEGVIVVGYSMGGAAAQVLARRHRDLLGGIVLCATAASFARRIRLRPLVRATNRVTSSAARAWPSGADAFLRWQLRRHDRAVAARSARGNQEPSVAEMASFEVAAAQVTDGAEPEPGAGRRAGRQGGRAGVTGPRGHDQWALDERALSHLAAFIESGAELNAYDSSSWLPHLDVPAAAVVTRRDQVVAPWRQEAMAALLPGCRRYSVDAGHDAAFSNLDIFLPVLARACSDLAGAADDSGTSQLV